MTKEELSINRPFQEMNVKEFSRNEALGIGLPAIIVVKDQDLLNHSQRLIQSRSEQRSFDGRTIFRDYLPGFVFVTYLNHQIAHPDRSIWYKEYAEPRDIIETGDDIILTAANAVHVFNTTNHQETVLQHPYLGNAHTTYPTSDNKRFLVSSAGFDSMIEYDRKTLQETWRWTAWEHGYNRSAKGGLVTANSEEAVSLRARGEEVILLDNSTSRAGFGIPTASRTTHINRAIYDYDPHFILATFYHQGTVVRIDRESGDSDIVMQGLRNPHAILLDNGGYMVTDAGNGIWYRMDRDFKIHTKFHFKTPEEPVKWIQFVYPFSNGLYTAADGSSQSVLIIDPKNRQYNKITNPPEWSIHNIAPVDEQFLKHLTQWK